MRRLLEYMCQKSLLREGEKLTEYTIAIDVLGKPSSFKESRDSSARVEVYRLRRKLTQFYEGAGHVRPIRIVLPQGRYCPEFTYQESVSDPNAITSLTQLPPQPVEEPEPIFQPSVVEPAQVIDVSTPAVDVSPTNTAGSNRQIFFNFGIAVIFIASVLTAFWFGRSREKSAPNTGSITTTKKIAMEGFISPAAPPVAGLSRLPTVRILAGYSGPPYRDLAGAEWGPDRFFVGGRPIHSDVPYVGRTYDQLRYANSRIGECTYDIPLSPGTYEVHLYFMEHQFAPELGRGENDRTFFLHLNNLRVSPAIDIESDTMGPNIADERIFKSVHPGQDGKLHIALESAMGIPLINAIEVMPGLPHAQLPVRLIPQRAPVTDHLGQVWRPDQYSFNGQTTPRNQVIAETNDPQLFSVERYGHFDYSIPVDVDSLYTVNLYFAETYFGPHSLGQGGVGSRVFNVMADGVLLFSKLDIFAQAGAGRALIKSAHHIKPSAQGKLNLTFEPVVNYALINAIEVLDEAR